MLSNFNYSCFPLIELVVFEEITVKTRLEDILLVVYNQTTLFTRRQLMSVCDVITDV